jgi:hypothetical protein
MYVVDEQRKNLHRDEIYLIPLQLVPGGWRDVHKNSFRYASEYQVPADLDS